MRWMWIDRIVELVPAQRLVAIKSVTLAEDHIHEHADIVARGSARPLPVMPASLIIEGMAQTAGILVGHADGFRQKVVLAKISRAVLHRDVTPGQTIRYTAVMQQVTAQGASVSGTVELLRPGDSAAPETIGSIDLMFSHLDHNMAGAEFPSHNFVFSENFRTLLELSGIELP